MTQNEQMDIALRLQALRKDIYNLAPMSDLGIKLFIEALSSLSYEEIKAAISKHLSSPDRAGSFFPRPADLIRAFRGDEKERQTLITAKTEMALLAVETYFKSNKQTEIDAETKAILAAFTPEERSLIDLSCHTKSRYEANAKYWNDFAWKFKNLYKGAKTNPRELENAGLNLRLLEAKKNDLIEYDASEFEYQEDRPEENE